MGRTIKPMERMPWFISVGNERYIPRSASNNLTVAMFFPCRRKIAVVATTQRYRIGTRFFPPHEFCFITSTF